MVLITALVRPPQAAFGGRQTSEPTSDTTAAPEEGERGVAMSELRGALKCRDGGDYQQSPNVEIGTKWWLIVLVNSG